MTVQEVLLKALSGEAHWFRAAEILGWSPRTLRRWRERYEKHGNSGLERPIEPIVDAKNLVLAPGFVDIHNHSTSGLVQDPAAETQVAQGITTIVVGADGSSPWPIAVGKIADLVLFDPDTVGDRATFQDPFVLATGVNGVWVSGVRVWDGRKPTGAAPGQMLRR